MNKADVMTLFNYNYWATERILEQAVRLRPEQFVTASNGQTSSLRDTLVHVVGSERLWRDRWETGASSVRIVPEDFPTADVLRRYWAGEEGAMRAYLDTLDDDALERPIRFARRGTQVAYTLWHLMIQLVNHGTHHRSEAAALLTAYGYFPGDLDFFFFVSPQG